MPPPPTEAPHELNEVNEIVFSRQQIDGPSPYQRLRSDSRAVVYALCCAMFLSPVAGHVTSFRSKGER